MRLRLHNDVIRSSLAHGDSRLDPHFGVGFLGPDPFLEALKVESATMPAILNWLLERL
jgi:hypothetical protein